MLGKYLRHERIKKEKVFRFEPCESKTCHLHGFDPPSLLGVAYRETNGSEPILVQYVIDEALHPAGRVKPQYDCTVLDEALEESGYPELVNYFERSIVDARATTKKVEDFFILS